MNNTKPITTQHTRTQADRVYHFIIAYKGEHDGNSPTVREIGNAVDGISTSRTDYLLGVLVGDGLIELGNKRRTRSIRVVGGHWTPPRATRLTTPRPG